MSESVQPIIQFVSVGRTNYAGVETTGLDVIFGAGSVQHSTLIGARWQRIRRNTTGDNVFGQTLGYHSFIHPFLDPTHIGPPYIMRLQEVISPLFSGAVGRVFFGLGGFTDVTDSLTLRGCGFYCDETGNWFALLRDAVGDRVRVDTTADTNQPRFLRVDIDAKLKTVRWYVDEVLRHTHVVSSALDQMEGSATAGLLEFCVVIQSDAGNQIDAFIAPGLVVQMSLITDEPLAVVAGLPPITQGLTYQRVINLARTRHPAFRELILDDNQVVDELNAMAMSMISIASLADHSAFQQVVNWNTDVFPSLDQSGGKVDLRDYTDIVLPGWVTGVYAIEAVKKDGSKIVVEIKRKESETRDRLTEADSVTVLRSVGDPKRIPRGFKVWDDTLRVFKIQKDETGESNPWQDVVDANFVVDGIRVAMLNRGDLTTSISMPFQALLPLVERYAVTLAGRAGLDLRWRESQRQVADDELEKWREFIGEFDMMEDEPFDPEIQ